MLKGRNQFNEATIPKFLLRKNKQMDGAEPRRITHYALLTSRFEGDACAHFFPAMLFVFLGLFMTQP